MRIASRGLGALGAISLITAACGDGNGATREDPPATSTTVEAPTTPSAAPTTTLLTSPPTTAAPAIWERQTLGVAPVDSEIVGASAHGTTVLLAGYEGGNARAWVSRGRTFEPADIPATDDELLMFAAVQALDDGFIAIGSGYPSFVPRVFTSIDGSSWARATTSGLDMPADIHALAATPSGLMAVGSLRVGDDPSSGPFEPAVWVSVDGLTWSHAASPVPAGDGYNAHIADLVATTEGVVAVTSVDGRVGFWRSNDDGASWTEGTVGVPRGLGSVALSSVATDGGPTLVGVGTAGDDLMGDLVSVRSGDAGKTWTVAAITSVRGSVEGFGNTDFVGGAWWALTSRFIETFDDPDACYRDIHECQQDSQPVLLYSTDGETWGETDLEPFALGEYDDVWDVLPTDEGALFVGGSGEILVWRWSGGAPAMTPPYSSPPPLDTPAAEWGGSIERGVRYRYPLYVHCGMGVLGGFNGRYWYLDEAVGPTPETGAGDAPPPDWPVAQQTIFGYVTLVDADTIEYSIGDGEVIATYKPSDREPPGCD